MGGRDDTDEVLILGGGPAGLAAGWAFEELGRSYRVLEAAPVPGGNSRTVKHGQFRFDTGPHRFHDRHPDATKRVMQLLGHDMRVVKAPSRIYWRGQFVDFPLRPLQVLTRGGLTTCGSALRDFMRARFGNGGARGSDDFAAWAYTRFGRTVADSFLIPFSEKLWGLPATHLSPDIAGRRLPGFTLSELAREVVLGSRASHLEGRFLYPRYGYGQIVDAMAQRLDATRLQCRCRVTRLHAEHDRITSLEAEMDSTPQRWSPAAVVSTLPITMLVRMLEPAPPSAVLEASDALRFRDVVLLALFLDRPSVSDAACIYFPDPDVAFTRAHEPKNRSADMSPADKTSLVVEFPCFEGDETWRSSDASLATYAVDRLDALGILERCRVEGSTVIRLRKAYPVYAKDYVRLSNIVISHLRGYANLESIGRGGGFFYGHVHDFISSGFAIAQEMDAQVRHGHRDG